MEERGWKKTRTRWTPNLSNPTQCIAKHRDLRRTRGEGAKGVPEDMASREGKHQRALEEEEHQKAPEPPRDEEIPLVKILPKSFLTKWWPGLWILGVESP